MLPDLKTMARVLGGEVNGGQVLCPGPGHSAEDKSLSVKLDDKAPDGFVVHSFSHDDPIICRDYVREKVGISAFKPNGRRRRASDESIERALQAAVAQPSNKPKAKIVATYDYKDSDGTLLYQVCRLEPKDFRQRRPDGKNWIWKLDDPKYPGSLNGQRVLYRLPELLKYPDATVFVCEGEKDADNVATHEYCATTVAHGKWTDECIKALAGRDVVILEDNDDAGRVKAYEAATALYGTAKAVRVVSLPGLPDKGDVSDWLEADPNNAKKFISVCFDTPEWNPSSAPPPPPPPLPSSSKSSEPPPLAWLDMSKWDNEPTPERKWAIKDRVPLNQAGLFSGEGGTGKSIIELTKDVAHATGKDWFGSLPECGPAFYIGAEDEADELHRRLAAIAQHYGVTFADLIKGGLHVLCKLGQDAVLCAANGKSGRVEVTAFYRQLYEAAGDIRPKNISIDTLTRSFAGNEIDRVQVYAFAMHMQALAMVAGGSVTVLSHPSLSGIASGSGISGSTAWHGAFRFRQYLKGVKVEAGEQPDSDVRELAFKKNQYGPTAETIVLRYQRGLFLPEAGITSLDKLAREAKVDDIFLRGLSQIIQQGRDAISGETSPEFGPSLILATLPEAKTERVSKKELIESMNRLLTANKIHISKNGPPSKAKKTILPGARPSTP